MKWSLQTIAAIVAVVVVVASHSVNAVEVDAMGPEARGCAMRDDCATCVRAPECGWCEVDKKCLPGTLEEPALTRGRPSKCIGYPTLWHFEEDSCRTSALRNLRKGPITPDPLFNPAGLPINQYIPQLSTLFPSAVPAPVAKNATNTTKPHNTTILGKDGKPLTPLQVKQLKIREAMVHDQQRLEAAKKIANAAAKAMANAAKKMESIRAEEKKELEAQIAKEKALAAKAAADAKRAAAEIQQAEKNAAKLKANITGTAPSKFLELESLSKPHDRLRRRNIKKLE